MQKSKKYNKRKKGKSELDCAKPVVIWTNSSLKFSTLVLSLPWKKTGKHQAAMGIIFALLHCSFSLVTYYFNVFYL